jgi:hypothetical protein
MIFSEVFVKIIETRSHFFFAFYSQVRTKFEIYIGISTNNSVKKILDLSLVNRYHENQEGKSSGI